METEVYRNKIKLRKSEMSRNLLKKTLQALLGVCVIVSFEACVNDDYDLSDVDTTASFTVTDLVVPINLDEITLEAVLDLDDDSRIKNIDGTYAFVDDGTFESDPIHVEAFTASTQNIEAMRDEIDINYAELSSDEDVTLGDTETEFLSFEIPEDETTFEIQALSVDESIVSIEEVLFDGADLSLTFSFSDLSEVVSELELTNVQISCLSGLDLTLETGSYDASSGVVTIESARTSNHKLVIQASVEAMSLSEPIVPDENRSFVLEENIKLIGGQVKAYTSDILSTYFNADGTLNVSLLMANVPTSTTMVCSPELSAFEVESFTGEMAYSLEGIDLETIEMTDIPDILNQTGTNLRLENPQIYLQFNNPVYEYGIYAESGLVLTSHEGSNSYVYTLDEPIVVSQADNYFCLSPTDPEIYYSGEIETAAGTLQAVDFAGAEYVSFSSLKDVLSGEKLPETIDVEVENAQIPQQKVTGFKLGKDIDPMCGIYVVYAPLDLTADSKIKYTDTFDNWNDEDIDALTITKLVVDADVSTDLPLEIELTAYPIDTDGNKMTDESGTTVCGTIDKTISYGMAEPVEITVSGTITHLDGIILDARILSSDESDEALQPMQTITMKNIKVTVSGSYTKEL